MAQLRDLTLGPKHRILFARRAVPACLAARPSLAEPNARSGSRGGHHPGERRRGRLAGGARRPQRLDPGHRIRRPDTLIDAGIGEAAHHDRIPGGVIDTRPGEMARAHLLTWRVDYA